MNQKKQQFNFREYIEDTPIEIGDYVIIDERYQDFSWYHSSIMKVLNIDELLEVYYNFGTDNNISIDLVKKLNIRKIQIERLIKNNNYEV